MRTWQPAIDGNDLVIGTFTEPATASWFGGPSDADDDGNTASGINNKIMGVRGCSLPMWKDANGALVPGCANSPLGPIPWGTAVVINSLVRGTSAAAPIVGIQKTVPLIDVGPDDYLNRALDLTPQTFRDLGGIMSLGLIHVFFRIIGGASYLKTGIT